MRSLTRKRNGKQADDHDAGRQVDQVIDRAAACRASDIHIEPTADGYELRFRIDGLLQTVESLPTDVGRIMVNRLMILAQLLTYRVDIPQEGRMTVLAASLGAPVEARVAIMPTTHGLRAAVRLPAELNQPNALDDLNLPSAVAAGLKAFAQTDDGLLLLTGPAGSGKTTTIYALLQYIGQHQQGVSLIALEDPVERDLPSVTQIEVRPFGELTYEKALRSILRQDPQVLMIGEIRDAAVAAMAMQAALSGHRLVCTLHAGSPAGAIARLLEMGLAPHQVAGSLFGVVAQRLLRRSDGQGRYAGRAPIAEFARMDSPLREAVLQRQDTARIAALLAARPGYHTLRQSANALSEAGTTDTAEVQRVLGTGDE